MPTRRLLLALLLAGLCFGGLPSVASAQPCWQRVISDWTKDGKIDGHYSPQCLRAAYKHTPEDLRDYSSILDDISAALIAKSSSHSSGGSDGPTGGAATPTSGRNNSVEAAKAKKLAAQKAQRAAQHAVPDAGTPASAPDQDRSVPLPLILLGAAVLLGALAGGVPHGLRWYRSRSPKVQPRPDSVRPPA